LRIGVYKKNKDHLLPNRFSAVRFFSSALEGGREGSGWWKKRKKKKSFEGFGLGIDL